MTSPNEAPRDDQPSPRQNWLLLICLAELLLLLGWVLVERLVLRPILSPTGLGAWRYLAIVGGLGAIGYVLMLLGLVWRQERAAAGPLRPARLRALLVPTLHEALDRALPAGVWLLCWLAPLLIMPAWPASAQFALGGALLAAALAWVLLAGRMVLVLRRPAEEADSWSEPDERVQGQLARLRGFAVDCGLGETRITTGPGHRPGEAAGASYRPTRQGPLLRLGSALLEILTGPQLQAVAAHELAHHRLGHAYKTVFLVAARQAVVAGVVVLLALTRQPSTWGAVRLAPSVLLMAYVLAALLYPLQCACERRQERHAHRLGLAMTRDPASLIADVDAIARHTGEDRAPGRLQTLLLDDCLAVGEITRLAERWAAENEVDLTGPAQQPPSDSPPAGDEEVPDDATPEAGILAIMPDSEDVQDDTAGPQP